MKLKLYGNYEIEKDSEAVYETDTSFNLVTSSKSLIRKIIRSLGNKDYFLTIDDEVYNLKEMYSIEVSVKKVFKIYFIFLNEDNKEKIKEALLKLKDFVIKTEADKENKLKQLFETMKEFSPFLILSNHYSPYIKEELINSNSLLLMKKSPDDEIEKIVLEKNDSIIDIILMIFFPTLLLVFVFATIHFFIHDNSPVGITFAILDGVEALIYVYSLFLINKEEKHFAKIYDKSRLPMYLIQLGGLVLGFGIATLLGATILTNEEFMTTMNFILISLAIAAGGFILLNIISYFVARIWVKKKTHKKSKVKI